MKVEINWVFAENNRDDILALRRVLYGYTDPDGKEILYIGKADGCSVRERLSGKHKEDVFKYLEKEIGLNEYCLCVGDLYLPPGRNFSSRLLEDTESLLIYTLEPRANVQSINSRISRSGMELICTGDWPLRKKHFIDN